MKNMIEVEHLVKNYKNVSAVRDVSFAVEEGSFFAFLGVNGAGKSTTINILCTVLEKTAGRVQIGGCDLDKDADKIRGQIGIVFQDTVLDKQLTVRENLVSRAGYYGLSRINRNQRIEDIAETFALGEIMDRRYEKLSGGQKRRVDIARALLNHPKLLFLDEPTTGLDPMTRNVVWDAIHKLRRETGLTVFLTTHYMEETALCDKVVILDNGQIAANDTPHKLKQKYAGNRLLWYTEQNRANDAVLTEENAEFTYHTDCYDIKLSDSKKAAALLKKYSQIDDFEFIKGNMDDVFMNVTGKRLGD